MAATGMSLLGLSGVSVHRGGRAIVRDVSFTAERGDIVTIMGESGAGKTTVIRAIAALEPIAAGTIAVDGFELHAGGRPPGRALRGLHGRVGIVFQFHHLFAHLTALQNVCLAPVHVRGARPEEAERRARALLAQLGVEARAGAMPAELSGGEAQRVAIARALAMDPPVLLMDEPTASLDPARRGDLAGLLRGLAGGGRTLIVATHDAEFARGCGGRVLVMDAGRLVRQGGAGEMLS